LPTIAIEVSPPDGYPHSGHQPRQFERSECEATSPKAEFGVTIKFIQPLFIKGGAGSMRENRYLKRPEQLITLLRTLRYRFHRSSRAYACADQGLDELIVTNLGFGEVASHSDLQTGAGWWPLVAGTVGRGNLNCDCRQVCRAGKILISLCAKRSRMAGLPITWRTVVRWIESRN